MPSNAYHELIIGGQSNPPRTPVGIVAPGTAFSSAIALDTRQRVPIQNVQCFSISLLHKKTNNDLKATYKNRNVFRTEPNPIYNCHGQTFASRRTAIDIATEVDKILEHDGYNQISRDEVCAGDIVIYRRNNGEVDHSGQIVHVSVQDILGRLQRKISVLSKWGVGSEVIHDERDCPYPETTIHYYRCLFDGYDGS